MIVGLLVEMAADALGERMALGPRNGGVTFAELGLRARRVARLLDESAGDRIGFLDLNTDAFPLAMLGAALAGKPFAPLNYRMTDSQLRAVLRRLAPATVVAGPETAARIPQVDGVSVLPRESLLTTAADSGAQPLEGRDTDPDSVAVLLFTSGTTGEPKAAVLRHRNLTSYIISSIDFAGAGEDEAALVSVPPYHIAAVSAVLSNLYSGRRVVRLESFDAARWTGLIRSEAITHAMVVPTMLGRILDDLDGAPDGEHRILPSLRSISYGGGPMPLPLIERALDRLPEVDFVNAYGLTETSSTIAVLGPEDHRTAFGATAASVKARLGSVGRPLPSVEVSIRDLDGEPVADGVRGEIWVRGDQVSGEYIGRRATDDDGWFHTRDAGSLDADGFLYVYGRLDDVIVRGGENLSPGEIEACLLEHVDVAEAAVFGIPDPEWGEVVAAAVVLDPRATAGADELREHVRVHLRSTCVPARLEIRAELPYTETGKVLRRVLRDEFTATTIGAVNGSSSCT